MNDRDKRLLRLLSDAEAEVAKQGLRKRVDGWGTEHSYPAHSFATVNAAVARGEMALYSKGKCAHLTDYGATILGRLREKVS